MTCLLSHMKFLRAALLLIFLCSGNVLLYSVHVVTEMGHTHQVASAYYAADDLAQSCSYDGGSPSPDGQQHHDHDHGKSCCESHSHVSIPHQIASMQILLQITQHPAVEPERFIPEVYLDKFIPPQNLA